MCSALDRISTGGLKRYYAGPSHYPKPKPETDFHENEKDTYSLLKVGSRFGMGCLDSPKNEGGVVKPKV
jgi:hypothetical protein